MRSRQMNSQTHYMDSMADAGLFAHRWVCYATTRQFPRSPVTNSFIHIPSRLRVGHERRVAQMVLDRSVAQVMDTREIGTCCGT